MTELAETAPGMDDTGAMYRKHFRLQQPLFEDGIAQDAQVFMTAAQNQVAGNLAVALTLRDSVALLTGPAGVGKTTLASHTLRAMTTRLGLGWVGTTPLTGHELLEMLLAEFGFSPYKLSRVERLQMWRQFLNEMRATDTCVCVLVENADGFQPEILAALESLTAADPNGCPGANIVLTARGPMTELFGLPALAALKQRTRMQCKLAPLTRDELRDYLAHRVTAAGGELRELMTEDAIDALHRYSGGIIRVANNLCVTAFTMAAAQQAHRLEAPLVAHVASDVFGIAPSATASLVVAPAAAPVAPALAPAVAPAVPAPEARPTVTPTELPVAPAMASVTPAPMPAAPAPVTSVAKPIPAPPSHAPATAAGVTSAVARSAATPRTMPYPPAMQPSIVPAAPTPAAQAAPAAGAATTSQPPSAQPATLPGLATVTTKPTPSQRLRAAIAAKSQPTSVSAPTLKPQSAPPISASPAAAKPSAAPVAPVPVAPRSDPSPAPPVSASATRSAAPPSRTEQPASRPATPSPPASRDDSIPMLTLDFEQNGDPFDLDFDMSAAQIDEALRTEMSDVPVLMDSVEVSGGDAAVDLSMRLALDEETQRKLVNLEALSHAKALEDISNSMAETLFGDAELDQLAATLALATSSLADDDDDDEALDFLGKHRAGT